MLYIIFIVFFGSLTLVSNYLGQLPSQLLQYLSSEIQQSKEDNSQKLVYTSIVLVRQIQHQLSVNQLNLQDALSISEQKTLKTALEIIVVWGIFPLLLRGVGIPLQRRSKLVTADLLPARYALGRDRRLLPSVELLLELVLPGGDFSVVIANNYLSDLFAALLQLVYAPAPEDLPALPPDFALSLISEETRKHLAAQLVLLHERYHFAQTQRTLCSSFADTTCRVSVQASYPALVMLIGGAAPDWIKKPAGLLLSRTRLCITIILR